MSPVTPSKTKTHSHYTSLSTPDSSPTRLPIRQKGSLTIPQLPQLPLPPLPEITNPAIRRLALTHSSNHSGQKSRKRDLIFNEHEAVLDNEKLEHVGDGLLTAAVITLLHELYPAFGPGPATYLRSHMVSNRSLAQIAEQYHLPEMFIAEAHSKYMIQAAEKAKGSLFEAYVAGVYYSFLMPRGADPSPTSEGTSPESEASEGSGETIKLGSGGSGTPTPGSGSSICNQDVDSAEEGLSGIETDRAKEGGLSTAESSQVNSTDPEPQPSSAVDSTTKSDKEYTSVDQDIARNKENAPSRIKPKGFGDLAKVGLDELFSHGLRALPAVKSKDEGIDKPTEEGVKSPPKTEEPTSTTKAQVDTPTTPKTPTLSALSSSKPLTPPSQSRTHGQAFDHLCTWLWPLFTPVAQFLSSYLESESSLPLADLPLHANQLQVQNIPQEWKVEDLKAQGAIGALNQFLGKTYGCGYLPTWITKKRIMDVWRMVAIVKTPEGREFRAEGRRLTKKAAMTVAAFKVWQDLKVWEEEQAELRRIEEEDQGDSEDDEGELVGAVMDVKVKTKDKPKPESEYESRDLGEQNGQEEEEKKD